MAADDELIPLDDEDGLIPLDETDELQPLGDDLLSEADLGDPLSSGLDDLMDDPLVGQETAAGTPLMPARRKKLGLAGLLSGLFASSAPAGRKRARANKWDSPLLLVGGGALLALILIGMALFFFLYRGSGDEIFNLAEEDYRAQAYGQAIAKYERFLNKYPKHPKASTARVRAKLAQLRQTVEGASDWQRALSTAKTVLPEIENEEAFTDARPELAGLLPDIMAGFAAQAQAAEDTETSQKFVDLAEEALGLVNNSSYLPTSQRQGQQARIEAIQEDLQVVRRDIDRSQQLVVALENIQEATEKGETAQAYAVRNELLKKYPSLDTDDALREAVVAITAKERDKVRAVESSDAPTTSDYPLAAEFAVALSSRSGDTAAGLENHVVFVLIDGAVFGLEASSGRVLWRRFVGYETQQHPIPSGRQVGSDALVVDGRHNELLRLAAQTGKLIWRVPLGAASSPPMLDGDRILVASSAGNLTAIDARTGQILRQVNFPQNLPCGPGVDETRRLLFQPGQHSSLYVLTADTLECREVAYVGHGAGNVSVPPVAVAGYVVVAENAGSDYALLHFFASDENGMNLSPAGEPLRVSGQLTTAPIVVGRSVLVVTDLGAIHLLEIDPADPTAPVRETAKLLATSRKPLTRYPLLAQARLWIGSDRLTKFELQTTRGQIVRKWVNDDEDLFVAPLQMYGNVIFHMRRRQGRAGFSVSAVQIDDRNDSADGKRIWETHLGVPAAGEPLVNASARQIMSISANADLFAIGGSDLKAGVAERSTTVSDASQSTPLLVQQLDLADGSLAVFGDSGRIQWLLYEPTNSASPLKWVSYSQDTSSHAPPTVFGPGLLVASRTGPVMFLDPKTGESLADPFQPVLQPGIELDWLKPVVIGESEALVAQRNGIMYRLGIENQPQLRLAARGQTQLDVQVTAAVARLADTLYVPARAATSDVLLSVRLPELTVGQEIALQGRVAWGPRQVGDLVLLASDVGELYCLDADGQRWSAQLENGLPAGQPLPVAGDLVMSVTAGTVQRLSAKTGQRIAQVDTGQPLATGPVAFGSRLLVSGRDGTLLVVGTPE